MDTIYNPTKIEAYWGPHWEHEGYGIPKQAHDAYCIMIPPPNVTGTLHMGHGFQAALMDSLIRYHRMQGYQTLWQVGTDHAGIATQMVVERQLLQQDITRDSLGRSAFLDKVWAWKQESGNRITGQFRRLGASVDWTRERFTMDKGFSQAVQTLFIKLYEDKLIYRGQKLVNWDPKLQTAISDLEVQNVQRSGHMWYLRYPITGSKETLVVATTRPETMFGDAAVCVHPDDKRYQHLHGKHVDLPLTGRSIPIIPDDSVDAEFGTGCVKITPAHDFNDHQVGLKHHLPMLNVMTKTACMNDSVPEAFQNLSRNEARKAVVKAFDKLGLLEKIVPHMLNVPIGDRSGVIIEPYLTYQWFVHCKPLAQPALACVRDGRVRFFPKNYENTYFHWLENIEDWCISRQLWWGHRIPAWYDTQGNIYVGQDEASVRASHNIGSEVTLTQDPDVLDTWFSSGLWPFATLGWPDQSIDLSTYFPTNTLVTGHDIIFYWVARMIMMSLYATGEIPFRDVYITGLIRDENNDKMSKSKGNIIDPLDLIDGIALPDLVAKRTYGMMQPELAQKIRQATEKAFPQGISSYGTDALRLTFCALASTGRDVRFDFNRLSGYRNFCNKLWNAARFILGQITDKPTPLNENSSLHFTHIWLLSRLEETKVAVAKHYANYRFDLLVACLYEFVWHDYCDWAIEVSKLLLVKGNTHQQTTASVLVTVLDETLRLLHPTIPFITEEIWQNLRPLTGASNPRIMLSAWPEKRDLPTCTTGCITMAWLMKITVAIRTMRAEMHISPAQSMDVLLSGTSATDLQSLEECAAFIRTLAKCGTIRSTLPQETLPVCAKQVVDNIVIHIPLAGLVDKEIEKNRVIKQQQKLQKQYDSLAKKLGNEKYIAHAPIDVLTEEKARMHTWSDRLQALSEHLVALDKL